MPGFSNLTLQLADATGVNTNSIQLSVGSLGTFTLATTNLTYPNGWLKAVSANPGVPARAGEGSAGLGNPACNMPCARPGAVGRMPSPGVRTSAPPPA